MPRFEEIKIEKIIAGSNVRMQPNGAKDLAISFKEVGLLNPITVRPLPDDKFEVIAGARRLAAARLAGMKTVPCIIRTSDNKKRLLEQITENVQRENLTGLEEAEAYHRYLAATGETRLQFANRIGKSESYVARVLSIARNLTTEEKEEIKTAPVVPPKEVLILASQTRDPKTRQAMLAGAMSSPEAQAAHSRDVAARFAGRGHNSRWVFSLPGCKVSIQFSKRTSTKSEAAHALKLARTRLADMPATMRGQR